MASILGLSYKDMSNFSSKISRASTGMGAVTVIMGAWAEIN